MQDSKIDLALKISGTNTKNLSITKKKNFIEVLFIFITLGQQT